MGLEKAKSLLEVRDGKTFLDLIAEQVEHTRKTIGAKVGVAGKPLSACPLLGMTSHSSAHARLSAPRWAVERISSLLAVDAAVATCCCRRRRRCPQTAGPANATCCIMVPAGWPAAASAYKLVAVLWQQLGST